MAIAQSPAETESMDVLIVDDDRSLCAALDDVLTAAGFAVDCVHDAAEACARLDRSAYDLVISDWAMPGSGRVVVSHAWQRRPDIPVILLSSELPLDLTRQEGARVAAQLAKPVAARELLTTVREVMKAAPERRRRAIGD